jgi:hypothetical protein
MLIGRNLKGTGRGMILDFYPAIRLEKTRKTLRNINRKAIYFVKTIKSRECKAYAREPRRNI